MTSEPVARRTRTARRKAPRRDQHRFDVAAQAIVRGNQDIRVMAVSADASPHGSGHIAVRVGRVLVYIEDRDALAAFQDAWERAGQLAEAAFGPQPGPTVYRPRR